MFQACYQNRIETRPGWIKNLKLTRQHPFCVVPAVIFLQAFFYQAGPCLEMRIAVQIAEGGMNHAHLLCAPRQGMGHLFAK